MSKLLKKITIIKPDDWHVHLRDNEILKKKFLNILENFYKRAIIMPNLDQPITNCFRSISYRRRILNSMKPNTQFQPLMICYLTEKTSPKELKQGFSEKIFVGAKLYPNYSTTNSKYGVKNIKDIYHLLKIMEKIKMPLLIHGRKK